MKTLSDVYTLELDGFEPLPPRKGRKPVGVRAMTDAERAKRYRERKRQSSDTDQVEPVNLDPSAGVLLPGVGRG